MPIDLIKALSPQSAMSASEIDLPDDLYAGVADGRRQISLAAALNNNLGRIRDDRPTIEAMPSGIALLDRNTGGLVRGEYVGVIGGPGVGKSTIADAILLSALRDNDGTTGLIIALETSIPVRCARLLAGESATLSESDPTHRKIEECVRLSAILDGTLSPREKQLAERVSVTLTDQVGNRLIFVDGIHDATDISEAIIDLKPDFVVVDHLGLVCADRMQGSSSLDRFDSALNAVARAVRHANSCAILIAEVSKQGLLDSSVDLSAVRGSARFASLAGQMIGIRRENQQSGDVIRLVVQLHKNRHGRSMMQCKAILHGGISHVVWGELSEIRLEVGSGYRRNRDAT